MTALHLAALGGHVDCVMWCLEMRANVSARDGVGCTPLHYASFVSGNVDIVRVLLDAGATVEARTNSRWSSLHCAIATDRVNVMRALIDRGAKVSNVQLDQYVPTIPAWVTTFVASRSKCRSVAVTIIGIHKFHRTRITGKNDHNVMRLIGKRIWSTRMDGVWISK
jgi:ankyrin repeat protein